MNNLNQILDNLFSQARRAPVKPEAGVELSKGLENRILADWKRQRESDEVSTLVPLFRWGFGFALTASFLIIATSAINDGGDDSYRPTMQVSTYAGTFAP